MMLGVASAMLMKRLWNTYSLSPLYPVWFGMPYCRDVILVGTFSAGEREVSWFSKKGNSKVDACHSKQSCRCCCSLLYMAGKKSSDLSTILRRQIYGGAKYSALCQTEADEGGGSSNAPSTVAVGSAVR